MVNIAVYYYALHINENNLRLGFFCIKHFECIWLMVHLLRSVLSHFRTNIYFEYHKIIRVKNIEAVLAVLLSPTD